MKLKKSNKNNKRRTPLGPETTNQQQDAYTLLAEVRNNSFAAGVILEVCTPASCFDPCGCLLTGFRLFRIISASVKPSRYNR